MDTYTLVILAALFGFIAVAFLLLAPVYLFLKREERASSQWTKEALAKRLKEKPPSTNGAATKQQESDM